MPPDNAVFNLASKMHLCTCRWNHTDGCGWYYEKGFDPDFRAKDKYSGRVSECLKAEAVLVDFKEKHPDQTWKNIIRIMDVGMLTLYPNNADEFKKFDKEFPL